MPDADSSPGEEPKHGRRRRRRRVAGGGGGEISATEAAGITLDDHHWHAGSGEGRARRKGRDGKDSGRRNVNPMVRRSNRFFVRVALLVLTGVALFAAYQQGTRTGQERERMRTRAAFEKAQVGSVADPSEARRLALIEVEKGYEARVSGDHQGAIARFQAAKDIDPRLPGAYVEMGVSWLRLRNPVEADTMFLKAIRSGEDASRAHYQRGILLAGNGSFPESFTEFQSSILLAPFDAYPWFYWADSLRMFGRPSEAIEKLQKAESRATEQSDLFVIRSKRLLCMIEANAPEIAGMIEAELAQPEPGGEWLLAAAAERLRSAQYAEAADFLARSRRALQPIFFAYLFNDKFFDLYRNRPEIAAAAGRG